MTRQYGILTRHQRRLAQLQVDPSVAEQSAKAKVSEFAFDCAMDSTDPNSPNYVSQEM